MLSPMNRVLRRFEIDPFSDEYQGVRNRFLNGFNHYVEEQLRSAVRDVLQQEFQTQSLTNNQTLVNTISKQLKKEGWETLEDQPFVFISLNRNIPNSLLNN